MCFPVYLQTTAHLPVVFGCVHILGMKSEKLSECLHMDKHHISSFEDTVPVHQIHFL